MWILDVDVCHCWEKVETVWRPLPQFSGFFCLNGQSVSIRDLTKCCVLGGLRRVYDVFRCEKSSNRGSREKRVYKGFFKALTEKEVYKIIRNDTPSFSVFSGI